ncbi:hypothetical protein ACHMW6_17775 [Pseudoduganella sp. UC29_106]|uniref:hypothetical protein n=1 Tax=Pseudoduganella sp. UC29_106 TaxID=3374553 RepID=UPI0037566CBC
MLSPQVPPELANAAVLLNHKFGTIYAWRFLSQNGIPTETIYNLLKNVHGPEKQTDVENIELWSLIEKANGARR